MQVSLLFFNVRVSGDRHRDEVLALFAPNFDGRLPDDFLVRDDIAFSALLAGDVHGDFRPLPYALI